MYAFCKSANMAHDKASAAYVERVLCGVVTREGGRRNTIPVDPARDNMERHQESEEEDTCDRSEVGDQDGDDADRGPDISPLLSSPLAATPQAAERLIDQTGPRILVDPARIATRILEIRPGSRRKLNGSTPRLPTVDH